MMSKNLIEKMDVQKKGNRVIEDLSIPKRVVNALIKEKLKIASAESCTGGMFAAKITDIPGASAIFERGVITYSNKAKIDELGVNKETLSAFGAVSKETAFEMAIGIQKVSKSDIGVSVTGVAGPGGGTKCKPVGLVYICAVFKNQIICRELMLSGSRHENRRNSVMNMFEIVMEIIAF